MKTIMTLILVFCFTAVIGQTAEDKQGVLTFIEGTTKVFNDIPEIDLDQIIKLPNGNEYTLEILNATPALDIKLASAELQIKDLSQRISLLSQEKGILQNTIKQQKNATSFIRLKESEKTFWLSQLIVFLRSSPTSEMCEKNADNLERLLLKK